MTRRYLLAVLLAVAWAVLPAVAVAVPAVPTTEAPVASGGAPPTSTATVGATTSATVPTPTGTAVPLDPTPTPTPTVGPPNATGDATTNVTAAVENTTSTIENTTARTVNGTVTTVGDVANATQNTTNASASLSVGAATGTPAGTAATPQTGAAGTGVPPTTALATAAPASPPDEGSPGRRGGGLPVAIGGAAALGLGTLAASALLSQSGAAADPLGGLTGRPLLRAASARLDRLASRLPGGFVRVLGAFGYSRYDDSDPLDHDARAGLYRRISATPGVYLTSLAAAEDLPLSTARHHLRVLETEGLVTSTMIRGRRRYLPARTAHPELNAALQDDATAVVLEGIARHGRVSVSALAEELDLDASTISHHLSTLSEAGLVVRERDGRYVWNALAPHVESYFENGTARATTD